MATARETIQKAFRYMGKETPNKQATAADYNFMLDELNKLLDIWFKLGLRLAVNTTTIPALDSEVPYPDFALSAIESNLAKEAWPFFNLSEPVSQSVREVAKDSKNEIWSIGRPIPKTVFPGVLPIGSGNESDRGNIFNEPFYPDCDEPIYQCDNDKLKTPSGIPLKVPDNE